MNRALGGILLGLLLVVPVNGFPADVVIVDAQRQYQLAQTLFEEKEFSAAAHEYIRFVHLFPRHERVAMARYNTGVAFFYAGQLEDARRHLQRMAARFSDAGLATDAMFKLSEVHMAMDNPGLAVSVLRNLITLSRNGEVRDRACFIIGWLLLDNADDLKSRSDYAVYPVREAKKYFSMISPEGEKKYRMADTMTSLNTIDQLKQKRPAVAGGLSLIPGGGFFYCERYRDALVSFLLNTSLMFAAYQSFENDNEFLGGVISFVEAGFYAGNVYGSVASAHKFNKGQKKGFIDRLKQDYRVNHDAVSFQPGFVNNGVALMFKYDF
ncbi:tetratricopeptide repeat protein [Desulfobacula sp.]|uniref:tetratricopeptide repeat protein n=1 Tax=Desulfobacula sp. TaxID=2593537 RepID=UPI0026123EAB|nr:tetratricopeptide repeat protein [Desulfobacula sp.]